MKLRQLIDLRSDTVTRPSPAMREAMANAEVGDDVFGEDPTVNRLQKKIASFLGKEAALFTPSGVMANQLAIKTLTQPGDEILVERDSHIFNYETAGPSLLSNVQLNPIQGTRGVVTADQLRAAVRSPAYYYPRTSLICVENTHNRAGGAIFPLAELKKIRSFARSNGIAVHLDGARIWNAWVATNIHPGEYARQVDTVSLCFSKGLGAPVGSAIAGSNKVIEAARKFRKIFGGGMRQAGILAAAALYAMEHNVDRLKEDHEKASAFADEVSAGSKLEIDTESVQTNIVIMDVGKTGKKPARIVSDLRNKGVLVTEAGFMSIRAVMHLDVSRDEVHRAAAIVRSLFS